MENKDDQKCLKNQLKNSIILDCESGSDMTIFNKAWSDSKKKKITK